MRPFGPARNTAATRPRITRSVTPPYLRHAAHRRRAGAFCIVPFTGRPAIMVGVPGAEASDPDPLTPAAVTSGIAQGGGPGL